MFFGVFLFFLHLNWLTPAQIWSMSIRLFISKPLHASENDDSDRANNQMNKCKCSMHNNKTLWVLSVRFNHIRNRPRNFILCNLNAYSLLTLNPHDCLIVTEWTWSWTAFCCHCCCWLCYILSALVLLGFFSPAMATTILCKHTKHWIAFTISPFASIWCCIFFVFPISH